MIKKYFESHDHIIAGTTLTEFGNMSVSTIFKPKENTETIKRRQLLIQMTKSNSIHVPSLIHSDHVLDLNKDNLKEPADALITNQKHQLIGVTTADCIPIFIYDPIKNVIGIVHSGRKGVKLNIVTRTIEKMMRNYLINPHNLYVHIGPHICGSCYEVDKDILDEFGIDNQGQLKGFLDLEKIVINDLKAMGVSHISREILCTKCSGSDLFYSYRNNDKRDRMLSFIGLR
ncbi:MAG: peptidoglycan editing factor PgeF [Brevinema sp.]